MRNVILSVAVAGAALLAASPAAAQYYPQPQPYGNAYGFQNNWGQVRALQARLSNVERQIRRLDRRDRIGDRSSDRLRDEANRIEERLHRSARGGLNPYEFNDLQNRVVRLEQRVQYAMNKRYNGYGYNNGYNGQWVDRDRDGRDDRWEHRRDRDDD